MTRLLKKKQLIVTEAFTKKGMFIFYNPAVPPTSFATWQYPGRVNTTLVSFYFQLLHHINLADNRGQNLLICSSWNNWPERAGSWVRSIPQRHLGSFGGTGFERGQAKVLHHPIFSAAYLAARRVTIAGIFVALSLKTISSALRYCFLPSFPTHFGNGLFSPKSSLRVVWLTTSRSLTPTPLLIYSSYWLVTKGNFAWAYRQFSTRLQMTCK